MKKLILILLAFVILLGCSNDKGRTTNPYLPNYAFSFIINLNDSERIQIIEIMISLKNLCVKVVF